MAEIFDVEPDEDSASFVENCLEEIRSKTLSTHISKISSTKCDKAVLGMLVEAALKRGDAVDDILRTIFERLGGGVSGGGGGSGEDSENAEEIADKRLYVFRKGIELIQREGLLTSRSAGDLVTLLTFQLDRFPDESLFDLIEDFVAKIKSADISGEESVELFPKVLATLAAKLKLTTEEGKSETGSEYKSAIIKRVLGADWRPESVVRIVALCKDMDLKEEEEKKLVDKVVSRLGQIDAKDLPPVVYQLLLLAGKHGLQRLVLKGLSDFFEERREEKEEEEEDEDDESEQIETRNIHSNSSISRSNGKDARGDGKDVKAAQLQRAQGTVLMHVATAMRHSRQLSQEIIKYLKGLASTSSKRILRPFNVALALSLAKIPLYEETVFRLMKDSVFNCFRDAILTRSSDWLRDLLLNGSADDILAASKATVNMLQRVVKAATSGWEHVLEQLVKFALILMEMAATTAAAGGSSSSSSSSPDWEHSPLIPPSLSEDSQSFAVKPEQLCGSAGSKMLLLLFLHHEEARFEIVEQLLNRLVIYAHNPTAGFV